MTRKTVFPFYALYILAMHSSDKRMVVYNKKNVFFFVEKIRIISIASETLFPLRLAIDSLASASSGSSRFSPTLNMKIIFFRAFRTCFRVTETRILLPTVFFVFSVKHSRIVQTLRVKTTDIFAYDLCEDENATEWEKKEKLMKNVGEGRV